VTREGFPCFPSSASDGAALAARTLHAVAHNADAANPQVVPVGVHTHRAQPYVVGSTTLWWQLDPDTGSMTLIPAGGLI